MSKEKKDRHAKVKGRSIQDLMSMSAEEFNKLSHRELKTVTSRLVSAANKRLKRFEKAGISTPAQRRVEESGGKFSVKGKSLNQTRAEFVRAKQFLESRSSTRKGWESIQKDTISRLAKMGIDIDKNQLDTLWKSYEKLKEMSPEVENRSLKYSVLKGINERIDGNRDPDEIAVEMENKITEIYESQAAADEDGRFSKFFEL